MLDLGTLRIGIEADTDAAKSKLKGFQEETKKTEQQTKDSSEKIKAATNDVKEAFGGLATGIKVAGAAIGAAFIATSKSALDAYASYEQNMGGIEKLFGDSASQVAKDAREAFLSCQVSANQYMEQVTSFSASLIGSLGGDTEKAASYAKTAMTDMADNANVFGTNIEDIQHAYQGFAKSNFTMLDNLKLGYGGTKEEMQRLIDDANKVKEANGEMADLSIDSFSDMVEAIHIMQSEMGIAGTTQNEALTTIEGSLNATKAAWDNWITGLGDSQADLQGLTKDLVDMVANSAGLIVQRLKIIAQSIIQEIPNIFSQIYAFLPSQIQGVIDIVSSILPAIAGVIAGIFAVVEGIKIGETISTLIAGFKGLWVVLAANPVLAVVAALAALGAAFATAYATNEDFRNAVNNLFGSIAEIVQPAIESIGSSLAEFGAVLSENLMPVLESFASCFATIGELLGTILLGALGMLMPQIELFATCFIDFASTVVASVLPVVQQIVDAFTQFAEFAAPIVATALQFVQSIFDAVFPYIQLLTTTVFSIIGTYIQTAMNIISAVISGVLAFIHGDWQGVFNSLKSIAQSIFQGIQNIIQTAINFVSSIISGGLSLISGIWSSAWNSLKSLVSGAMGAIGGAVSTGINNVVNFFRNLPGNIVSALGNLGSLLVDAGSSIIDGLLSGLKSGFEGVKSFVGGIGSWIAAHKGPKEYDLKLLIPNGGWIMDSLATGLTKSIPTIQAALDEVASGIQGYNFGSATVEASFRDFQKARESSPNGAMDRNTTNNTITVNNYSPQALNEKDSAREFRKTMRQMAFA